jgi:hypothetical protein
MTLVDRYLYHFFNKDISATLIIVSWYEYVVTEMSKHFCNNLYGLSTLLTADF